MWGKYESPTENSKNQYGAKSSRAKFQNGPYKTSHTSKYLNVVAIA